MQYSGALQPGASASIGAIANRTYPSPPVSSTDPVHPVEPNTRELDGSNPLSPGIVSLAAPVQNQTPPDLTKEQTLPNTDAACNTSQKSPAPVNGPDHNSPQLEPRTDGTTSTAAPGANVTLESHHENGEQPTQEVSPLSPGNTSGPHDQNGSSIPNPSVAESLPLEGPNEGHTPSQTDNPNIDTSDAHRDKRVCMAHPLSRRPSEPSAPVTPGATPATEVTPCQTQTQAPAMPSDSTEPMSMLALAKSLETWKNGMPNSVHVRISHLQSACKSRDFQYLALHQMYAIGTVWPQSLLHLPGFGKLQMEGLRRLGSQLISNSSLPVEFVVKCCDFPLRFMAISTSTLPYAAYMPIAMKTLEFLHTKWDEFEQRVLSRRIPPLIDDIENQFNIRSPILQRAIYTACCRRLRPTNQDDKWRRRYDEVYLRNERYHLQRWDRNRTTPVSVEERKAQNEELLRAYQQILLDECAEDRPEILMSEMSPGTVMFTATSGPSQAAQHGPTQTQPTPPQSTRPGAAGPIPNQPIPTQSIPTSSVCTQPVSTATTPLSFAHPQPTQPQATQFLPEQPQSGQYPHTQYQPTQRQFTQGQPVQSNAEQRHMLRQVMISGQTVPSTCSHGTGNPQTAQPRHQASGVLWHNGVAYVVPAQVMPAASNFSIPSASHQATSQVNGGARPAFVVPSMGTSQPQQTSQPATTFAINNTRFQQVHVPQMTPFSQPNAAMAPQGAQHAATVVSQVQSPISTHTQYTQSPAPPPASQHIAQGFSRAPPQSASQLPLQSTYPPFAQSYAQYAPQSVPSPAPKPTRPGDFVPNTRTPIFPRDGYVPPIPAQPNPLMTGLHLSHLLISHRNLGLDGKEDPSRRLCQYVHSYARPPFCLGKEKSLFEFKTQVGPNDFKRLAKPMPTPPDHPIAYGVMNGSLIYQLRCARVDSPTEVLSPDKWVELECSWPDAIYIIVNGVEHHIRRKLHHGKDLPVIITKDLREGYNDITLAFVRGPDEYKTTFWAVAVEVVVVVDHERICQEISKRPASACVERIVQKLNKSSTTDNDDDICIVGDHISIDLVDPFTARIFDVPVRGTHCAHPECFDLEMYLDTRRSKTDRGNGMAEAWKCPLCGTYASPPNLYIDEFLLNVREDLSKRGQLESVKAIIVKRDGSWEAKAERQSDSKARVQTPMCGKPEISNATSQRPTPAGNAGPASASPATKVPEVIELD